MLEHRHTCNTEDTAKLRNDDEDLLHGLVLEHGEVVGDVAGKEHVGLLDRARGSVDVECLDDSLQEAKSRVALVADE